MISFELQYTLDGDKKQFMENYIHFYIILNKFYLYNLVTKLQYE